jgi:lactose/L-arabinose transport system permease protein
MMKKNILVLREKNIHQSQKKSFWHEIVKARWPYLFISPFYFLFLIFGAFPLVFSFILSFTTWKGTGPLIFNNFGNYKLILTDKVFWQSMQNGLILFFMYVPFQILLACVLAVILNSKRVKGFKFFRTVIFMPYISSMVAAGFVFQLLFGSRNGLVNSILGFFTISPIPWLDSVWGARFALCALIVWAWLGYNMVFILAGLQTISSELTEAAMIDGANQVQAFFLITIPLLRPVILFCVINSTIGSFNLFGELMSMFHATGGSGPLNAVITPLLAVFGQAFHNFKLGYASTQAYVYFLLIFVVALLQLRLFNKEVD